MSYAHLILHTDEYDHDTDIYDHLHMSAYVPICAYICMYSVPAIYMCLYVWFLHMTYMHIKVYMHRQIYAHFHDLILPVYACIVSNICTFS